MSRFLILLKALRDLGLQSLALYAWYQVGLRSGYLRRMTGAGSAHDLTLDSPLDKPGVLSAPDPQALAQVIGPQGREVLQTEAGEILDGQVRLFGGEPRPLTWLGDGPMEHWTAYERGKLDWGAGDVKFIWEPARFGWVYALGRVYRLSGQEQYAEAFWHLVETFLQSNPPNVGPQWASAQEVALRILALVFAWQVLADGPSATNERVHKLVQAIAGHAERIPPTLAYARSQNNNHLLSEAIGLYTAGSVLPVHPKARGWREQGWFWFNWALQNQIADDGAYVQHSTNYHRLMLQLALWAAAVARFQGVALPAATCQRLAAATRWGLALLDRFTGCVPNLGPNDGAYILPLTTCPFNDHRPVLQAAARAFLGETPFPDGPWDEMSLWFKPAVDGKPGDQTHMPEIPEPACVLRSPSHDSWAYVRVAKFRSRPGHADQLHMDLWWRGLNVAQDPGSYRYNAPPPWENALASTEVHNTLTVDGQDQMRRAGRFLWLDWAQGQILSRERLSPHDGERLIAQHNGYRRLGVCHRRTVTVRQDDAWLVEDHLTHNQALSRTGEHCGRLHWLLPDWPWELLGTHLRLHSPHGEIQLLVSVNTTQSDTVPSPGVYLIRAGEMISGEGSDQPILGWISHTYDHKKPALSFVVALESPLPIRFTSEWVFP